MPQKNNIKDQMLIKQLIQPFTHINQENKRTFFKYITPLNI